jgi:hypothetical protein
VSPWKGLPQLAMLLILVSAILTMIGDKIVKIAHGLPPMMKDPVHKIGTGICKAALAVSMMAMAIGAQLVTSFGQNMLGSIYSVGALAALFAAVKGMDGGYSGSVSAEWFAGIAGTLALLGSMAGAGVIKGTNSIFPAKGASSWAPVEISAPSRPYKLADASVADGAAEFYEGGGKAG